MYGSLFKPCLCWWNILFIHATLTPNFFVFIIILRIIIFWMMITIQTLSDVCFQSLFPVPVSKSRLAEEVSKISLGFFFLSSFLSSQGIKQWNFAKTIWISKLHKSVLWAWSTKFREVLSYWPCCLWKLVQPSFTVLTLSSCCLTHVI